MHRYVMFYSNISLSNFPFISFYRLPLSFPFSYFFIYLFLYLFFPLFSFLLFLSSSPKSLNFNYLISFSLTIVPFTFFYFSPFLSSNIFLSLFLLLSSYFFPLTLFLINLTHIFVSSFFKTSFYNTYIVAILYRQIILTNVCSTILYFINIFHFFDSLQSSQLLLLLVYASYLFHYYHCRY